MNRRLWTIAAAFLFCLLPIHQLQSKDPAVEPLRVADLKNRPVIGRLGVPLGPAIEVRATIVASGEQKMRKMERYLLRVSEVNGRPIQDLETFDFDIHAMARGVSLARNVEELRKLKGGAKNLTLEQLEQDYVGKGLHLLVYEGGGFTGMPRNLPKGFPMWADTGFHFRNTLVVLEERPDLPPEQKVIEQRQES